MTSKKRILETRMWAKCQQIGEILPEETFSAQVNILFHMMPEKIQAEIEAERKDYLIFKTGHAIFQDIYYRKIVGIDYEALHHKIREKMMKKGFTEE